MIKRQIIFHAWKARSFFTQSGLLNECFQEKSASLKKFKVKQAKFQKDDGIPIFLKAGFRDKLLFNITWVAVAGGILWSFYSLKRMDQHK